MFSTTHMQVSRRQLLKVGLGSAFGLGLAAVGIPALGMDETKVGASALPFEAYHGVTGAYHQARFDDLSARGYRIISISIYGDPADARYAAVWVQRSGPAFIAVHGITTAEYQAAFDNATAQGYAPVLVSATGPIASARFAAVFEQGIVGAWKGRHGLVSGDQYTAGTVEHENGLGYTDKLYMRSVTVYGDASNRRYAAIWHTYPVGRGFGNAWQSAMSAGAYQQVFNDLAESSLGYRPATLAVASDATITSVFRSDAIGVWSARHNLTSDQYQQAFNDATAQGLIPLCVQGGGVGANTRYAAIFAARV